MGGKSCPPSPWGFCSHQGPAACGTGNSCSHTPLAQRTHVRTHTCKHMHAHTHACTHVHTCVHTLVHTCTHRTHRTHTHLCTHAHTCARTHTHTRARTCTRAREHTRMHAHTAWTRPPSLQSLFYLCLTCLEENLQEIHKPKHSRPSPCLCPGGCHEIL